MRILYLGLPLGAVCLARAGHVPVALALGHPDAPGRRRVHRLCPNTLVLGRPDLDDPGVRALVASASPDVILSFFWPKRIPKAVLDACPRGAFGVHPSLLPRWRGPDPLYWTLRTGEVRTGVTLHRLEPDYDTGAIVAQRFVDVAPEENAYQLARRLDRPALALLVECADRLRAGEALEGRPQDPEAVTYAPSPRDDELAIDWKNPSDEIVRLVRAAAPIPGASAQLGDREVIVVRAAVFGGEVPRALRASEAFETEKGFAVRTGDGRAVLLEDVRDVDGRPLPSQEVRRAVTESNDSEERS